MKKKKTPDELLIYMREYQARIQEIKDAPKFREYIRWLLDNIDVTEDELKRKKRKEYQDRWLKKKKNDDTKN